MDLAQDLQSILVQERSLVFSQFDAGRAWALGARLREMAQARGHAVAIEIATFGQPLFFAALDGATPDHAAWIARKRNTAAHFRRSSYAIGLRMKQAGTTLVAKHALPAAEYAEFGGAFPLGVAGVGVIGTATVSGLAQRADHELVVEALSAELGRDYAALALTRE